MVQDVLSQTEIDKLLAGLRSGEIDPCAANEGKQYHVYDFRRPSKFSKDNLRTLQLVHETYSRHCSSTLAGYLRIECGTTLNSIEQVTCEEFLRSLPTPTVICIAKVMPGELPILLEINLSVVFGILDRVLGGPGAGTPPNRELTEIEMLLMNDVMDKLLADLSSVWSTVVEADFRPGKIESQPTFAQVVPPNEIVLNVCFDMAIGAYDGIMNLCFPFSSLERLLASLNTEQWLSSKTPNVQPASEELRTQLVQTTIPVSVELGKAKLTLDELHKLESGQVIRLNKPVDSTVLVKMGEQPAFIGRPGTSGKHLAVQVQKRLLAL